VPSWPPSLFAPAAVVKRCSPRARTSRGRRGRRSTERGHDDREDDREDDRDDDRDDVPGGGFADGPLNRDQARWR
jgi:hypothetical protein